jgi:hypothetical protein
MTAGETACKHTKTIDLPDSIFTWCRQCGAVKRRTNDPTVQWIPWTREAL